MTYQWKSNSRIKTNADQAGAVCEQLEKTIGLTPKTLLEASRDENSVLHNEFEWNDGVAAELYRETQAGHIIRCLCIVRDEETKEQPMVRAYFNVEKEAGYENLQVILVDKEKTNSLFECALKELQAFERKYSALEELKPIFAEIMKLGETRIDA